MHIDDFDAPIRRRVVAEQLQAAQLLPDGADFSLKDEVDALFKVWDARYPKQAIISLGADAIDGIYALVMDLDCSFDVDKPPASYENMANHNHARRMSLVVFGINSA